jgi:membrane-bound ClpP family serine protease
MTPFILLALGLLFVAFEFYLPGAILGVIGGALLFFSVILFARDSASPTAILLFVMAVFAGLAATVRIVLKRIISAKPEYSICSDDDQEGFQASSYDVDAIGKVGVVLSDLKPGGYILIDGVRHQALSTSTYISMGESVVVISGQEESLIVKPIKKESRA